jgi:hypothetical protein
MGKRGTYLNTGLPGTGISCRKRIDAPRGARIPTQGNTPQKYTVTAKVSVSPDGTLLITDESGNALPPSVIKQLKAEQAEDIEALLSEAAGRLNDSLDQCLGVHLRTPSPSDSPKPPEPFHLEAPVRPIKQVPSLLDKLLLRSVKMEQKAAAAEATYQQDLDAWNATRDAHEKERADIENTFRLAAKGFSAQMESALDYVLSTIQWPRSTTVEYAFTQDLTGVAIDVDLPDEDETPRTTAEVKGNGKLTLKTRSDAQCRRDFVTLCFGSLFRVVGEVFTLLPGIEKCLVSGYIQRPNAATGGIDDDYIISVVITRAEWNALDFSRLEHIDPAATFRSCGARVILDRSSRFKAIGPYEFADIT